MAALLDKVSMVLSARGEGLDSHDSEDNVGLVADVGKGNRGDHDDHEVPDPVGRGGQGVGRGADLQRHNLSRVQPGHTQPTDGEAGVENEEEDGLRNTRLGTDGVALVGGTDALSDGQDNHGQRHADGTPDHQGTTTELLDGEHGNPRGQEVLGTVASGDQTGESTAEADTSLQQGRDVVSDQVDTGDLLEHLVDVGQHGTVEVTVRAHGEHVAEGTLGHLQDGSLDRSELVVDVDLIGIITHQAGQDLTGLVLPTLQNEPTGRLREEHDKGQNDRGEEDLESKRESPGNLVGVGEHQTEVNPVTDGDTAGNHGTLDHDHLTTTVGLAALGLPGGNGGGVDTVPEARDETTDDQLGELVRGTLQDRANTHDEGTEEDRLATTEHVTDPDGGDRTGETAQVVRSDSDTLTSGLRRRVVVDGVDRGEILDEGLQRQQTASHTLVVAEQQEVHTRQDTDGDLELGSIETQVALASHLGVDIHAARCFFWRNLYV